MKEEDWKRCEAQNDAVEWGTKVTGWEASPPPSPVARVNVAGASIWPTTAEHLARVGTWPTQEELLNERVSMEVTVEVHTSIGDLTGEHSICRSLYGIVY
jgi:hypothetical protein